MKGTGVKVSSPCWSDAYLGSECSRKTPCHLIKPFAVCSQARSTHVNSSGEIVQGNKIHFRINVCLQKEVLYTLDVG